MAAAAAFTPAPRLAADGLHHARGPAVLRRARTSRPSPDPACRRSRRCSPPCTRRGPSAASRSTAPRLRSPRRSPRRSAAASVETALPSVDDLAARRRRDSQLARTASSAASAAATRPRRSSRSRPRCASCRRGAVRTANPAASAVADRALAAMAGSALRDPVEGGFFRYATRRDWTRAALRADADRQRPAARRRDRCRRRADRARHRPLPHRRAAAARPAGSAPHRTRSPGSTAHAARAAITRGMPRARADLDPPAVDGKVVTGWNGLAIGALARAGARLDEPAWIEAARWAAEAVLGANVATGRQARARIARRDRLDRVGDARRLRPARLRSRRARRRDGRGRLRGTSARSRARLHRCRRVRHGFRAAVIRCSPRRASRRRMPRPTATSRRALRARRRRGVAVAARRTGRHCAPSRSGSSPRTRPARSRSLSRTVRCCASRRSSLQPPRQLVVVAEDAVGPAGGGRAPHPVRRLRDRHSRAGRGVVARGLRAVRGQERAGRRARRPTTAGTSPAACRSPTLPSSTV